MDDEATVEKQLQAALPEVIGAVITHDQTKINLCPVNYQAISSIYEHPVTVCIGLSNGGYTLKNILTSKQFVYAYPTAEQLKDIIYCGTVSGQTVDKLANTKLKFSKSDTVDPPNLEAALINFECRLEHSYVVGDFTLVLGVVQHINRTEKQDAQKIYSLGGMKYGTIKTDTVIQEGR